MLLPDPAQYCFCCDEVRTPKDFGAEHALVCTLCMAGEHPHRASTTCPDDKRDTIPTPPPAPTLLAQAEPGASRSDRITEPGHERGRSSQRMRAIVCPPRRT